MGPGSLEFIAPMIITVVLILTVGGVILLKPISKHLGALLEAMAYERSNPPQLDAQFDRLHDALETMSGRLSLLEERQDFTDALLADPQRQRARLGRLKEAEKE
jgi:hypothetical protein